MERVELQALEGVVERMLEVGQDGCPPVAMHFLAYPMEGVVIRPLPAAPAV
jgi:hypothetical protein